MDQNFRFSIVQFVNGPGPGPRHGPGLGLINHKSVNCLFKNLLKIHCI